MTVYLSPGDYHHFHSPCQWGVRSWSHFAGQLLPVNALGVNLVPGLFAVNERVCCFGEWEHGFMSYSAVGAFGVGSVHLSWDSSCNTNQPDADDGFAQDKFYSNPVELAQGDDMGSFSFGSTIVLVFEAPADLQWAAGPGDKIRMGQSLVHGLAPKAAPCSTGAYSLRRSHQRVQPLSPQRQLPMLLSSDDSSDEEGSDGGLATPEAPLKCAHPHNPLLVGEPPLTVAKEEDTADTRSVSQHTGVQGGWESLPAKGAAPRPRGASWMSEDAASVMSAATGGTDKALLLKILGEGSADEGCIQVSGGVGGGGAGGGWGRSSVCSVLSSRSAMSKGSSILGLHDDSAVARLRLRARMTMGDMPTSGAAGSVASGRSRGSAFERNALGSFSAQAFLGATN
jgi:hypothetical protein